MLDWILMPKIWIKGRNKIKRVENHKILHIFLFEFKKKYLHQKQMFDIIVLNNNTKLGDDNIEQITSRRI